MVWSGLARVGFFSYKFGHFSSLGEYSTTDVSNNKNKKSFSFHFNALIVALISSISTNQLSSMVISPNAFASPSILSSRSCSA